MNAEETKMNREIAYAEEIKARIYIEVDRYKATILYNRITSKNLVRKDVKYIIINLNEETYNEIKQKENLGVTSFLSMQTFVGEYLEKTFGKYYSYHTRYWNQKPLPWLCCFKENTLIFAYKTPPDEYEYAFTVYTR